MGVHHVERDDEFPAILDRAGPKLVVVDFFATWCGPCRTIAPVFERLAAKYPQVFFAKLDVEKCPVTAQSQGVSAMPTFQFFVNKVRVDTMQGANPAELENKVKKWVESAAGSSGDGEDSEIAGQMDLFGFITKKNCECLNESESHPLGDCLNSGGAAFLESDADEQLIINIPFNQPVKLHSLKIKGPSGKTAFATQYLKAVRPHVMLYLDCGPKTVKIFINQPHTLDFDQATAMEPTQLLELTEKQVANGEIVNLRFVKFQNVQNVQFFISENLSGSDVTRISMLKIFGSPINVTNMHDFKRVAGKKGESH